jgi:hypothetical protein
LLVAELEESDLREHSVSSTHRLRIRRAENHENTKERSRSEPPAANRDEEAGQLQQETAAQVSEGEASDAELEAKTPGEMSRHGPSKHGDRSDANAEGLAKLHRPARPDHRDRGELMRGSNCQLLIDDTY